MIRYIFVRVKVTLSHLFVYIQLRSISVPSASAQRIGTHTLFFFFHPIILFSNSFLDFPLFLEYFPIILIILHDLGTYAVLRAWLETRLTSNLPYTTESTRVGKSEDDRAEKALSMDQQISTEAWLRFDL